ncbi:MAG: hypothetical protein ACRCSB_05780, partial [Bacteroidales bacterium]
MMDINKAENTNREELDLLQIGRNLAVWSSKTFWFLFAFLLRKSLWLLGSVVMGTVFAFIIYYTGDKHYESSAIVISNSVESSIAIELLEQLNNLLTQREYTDLAMKLQLPIDEVKKIKEIKGYYGFVLEDATSPFTYSIERDLYIDNPKISESTHYFKVQVTVNDESIYSLMGKALYNYFSSVNYASQLSQLRQEQVKEQLKSVDKEIAYLHRAFGRYGQTEGASGNKIMLAENTQSEVGALQEALLNAEKRKNHLEEQQLLQRSILSVVLDFSKTYVPSNSLHLHLKYAIG